MAWQEFYLQPTGDDRNSGSDSNNTPTLTVTGGTISAGSIGQTVFTAPSGTPFSGVSVGQYVSLYHNTDTVSKFVGQVLSIGGGGLSITVSNDKQTGTALTCLGKGDLTTTALSSAAGAVACNVGGAWASLNLTNTGNALALPYLASTGTSASNLRINIQAGTYPAYSATITLPSGSAAKPIWWRGYFSTIGDLDNCTNVGGTLTGGPTGATRPQFSTGSTGHSFSVPAWNWLENLEFSGPPTGGSAVLSTSGYVRLVRCRGTATSIASNGFTCFGAYGGTLHAIGCLFVYNGGGSATAAMFCQGYCSLVGNAFQKGLSGLLLQGQGYLAAFNLVEAANTGISYQNTNALSSTLLNNVVYNCTTGVSIGSGATGHVLAANNLLANCTSGVVNSATANAWTLQLINTGFATLSGSQTSGLFESFQRGAVTEPNGVSPFNDAPNHDFSLTATALARQAGFPGTFETL